MIDPDKELSSNALLTVLAMSANATAVYISFDLHIQFANNAMLQLWGKKNSIIGKTLANAMPELVGEPFIDLLQNVWSTTNTYTATSVPATIETKGILKTSYFDFEYRAIKNEWGKTYCILHTAADVTDRITYKRLVKEKTDREHLLNEALQASNEEFQVLNEELKATNEELYLLNDERRNLNEELNVTNEKLNFYNQEFQVLNEELTATNEELHLINEERRNLNDELNVTNEKLNIYNQEFQVLNEELTATNEELHLLSDERQNLNEELNVTNEELNSLNDEHLSTNEQLNILNEEYADLNIKLKAINTQAQLAGEAAGLGMFDLDIAKDKLQWDKRCKSLFGVTPEAEVTYSGDFVKGLHPADKDRILTAVANAYDMDRSGGRYDVEFRTVGIEDKAERWVRAIGQVIFSDNKTPLRFIGIVMDITEQKKDDQRKNDFIGMVSHELKTPLTSLSAYLQVMQGKAAKAEDAFTINALGKSLAQVKKMNTMINGFLNVSRLESGKIHIDKKEFDMADLVREVEEETTATINSHKIIFAPVEPMITFADKDKIGQVINNFISNAVKYSPPDTTINVACVTVDGQVLMSVRDEGMGIAQQNIDKLFGRYYRVEGSHTATISGFGIGLYLSAEIIERHEGKIGVESQIGKGSTFWFSLPQQAKK